MSTQKIDSIKPEDGHSFISSDIAEGFKDAFSIVESQNGYSAEPIYIFLPDGNMIGRLDVVRETLTDGSVVFAVHIVASR